MALRLILMLLFVAIALVTWLEHCAETRYRRIAAGVEALPERHFDELAVVAVGTGGSYENHDRFGPCIAVGFGGRIALVDAGRAVAEGLRAAGIPVAQPDTVLLTNLLPENTVGLDDLLLTGWLGPRTRPLRVIGPPGTATLVQSLRDAHHAGIEAQAHALGLAPEGAALEAVEIEGGWSESWDGLTMRAGALPGGPLPALAYRFEAGGRSAVVAGTGWAPKSLVDFARGADLLVHEALHVASMEAVIEAGVDDPEFLRREKALHTSLADVGGLAQRAGVGKLVLVRLRPPPLFARQFESRVAEDFAGQVVIAEDGAEIRP